MQHEMKRLLVLMAFAAVCAVSFAQRTECLLRDWHFSQGASEAVNSETGWRPVRVPHDWAITGPFSRDNDLQRVQVTQNNETTASEKTGRTGGLPYEGVGWYRTTFDADTAGTTTLVFDGAMSEARVYLNGEEICFWPYGYNSFYCDATPYLRGNGRGNRLVVRLENRPQSSRWYCGAGLYRNVHLIHTNKVHVPVWGTQIITPQVSDTLAAVELRTTIAGAGDRELTLCTDIINAAGQIVATKSNTRRVREGEAFTQHFLIRQPQLWSPENPSRYRAVTKIYSAGGRLEDTYETRFGVRSIAFVADEGFFLNGQRRKFKGVCNHHDLGPLGAAVNKSALRHQLLMLKDMGCDAVRTSHNMPAPELVALCDSLGLMMMIEPFDEWDVAKCLNGYHRYFAEWSAKDMRNMLRHYRNNPSVIMWSIGNEVPTQHSPEGYKVAKYLQDICHEEDPTRPVTCGMDQIDPVLNNGFAALLDIPGFNYRAHRYVEAYERLPQCLLLGTETTSTVSSRGVYHWPVERRADVVAKDHQSSSYDVEVCNWSNTPDEDFALADDHPWTLGQFVWTGFDYLGEPTPYDTDAWPNHSSLFGIIDLASLPKDRYYLYRSQWKEGEKTLHILPHWTWPGREGQITPVFVYTDAPSAELFLNGKSLGRRMKNDSTTMHRYRLMWNDVVYEPGELRVVAYDKAGRKYAEASIRTAGEPDHLVLKAHYEPSLVADGDALSYVTVSLVDKDGNLCPQDGREVKFSVSGAGRFEAAANGDPTCLDSFQRPQMHLFSGMCTAIVRAGEKAGTLRLKATAAGVKGASLDIPVLPAKRQ